MSGDVAIILWSVFIIGVCLHGIRTGVLLLRAARDETTAFEIPAGVTMDIVFHAARDADADGGA